MKRTYRLSLVTIVVTCAAIGIASAMATPAVAGVNDTSHIRITSSVPGGGTYVDPVIDNQIQVEITIQDTGVPNTQDSGTLVLYPNTNPPGYSWNCHTCGHNYFAAVSACPTAGGCANTDVQLWTVGVVASSTVPDLVRYDIDSTNLGNGLQFASGPNCSTAVTPVTATYSATDYKAAWDSATTCTNSGVSLNLDYQ